MGPLPDMSGLFYWAAFGIIAACVLGLCGLGALVWFIFHHVAIV
jgi:hypothetical protein